MSWVRTATWTSKLSYAECMKHFRKVLAPALKDSPATSIMQIQTGPNSGLMILEFEGKRALNQHEKMIADTRTAVSKELKLKVKVVDGPVTWSRKSRALTLASGWVLRLTKTRVFRSCHRLGRSTLDRRHDEASTPRR